MSFKGITQSDWEQYKRDQAQRDCAIVIPANQTPLVVAFCTDNAELTASLLASTDATLYGQYNQINVCQFTVKGVVTSITGHDAEVVKKLLRDKIDGSRNHDPLRSGLDQDERTERLKLIASGAVFQFEPREYEYYQYQRG